MKEMLWKPDNERIKNSNIKKFMDYVNERYSKDFRNYFDLYKWSTEKPEDFWESVWYFTGIKYSRNFDEILSKPVKFPGAEWFKGAELNFAENLLRYEDGIAIKSYNENGKIKEITYENLRREVSRIQNFLKEIGVKENDRVVGYMPNISETVIYMLATSSLGAIWSSAGTELGPGVIENRFSQIEPKIMFTVDGYYYKGKKYSLLENIKSLSKSLISLKKVVIFSYIGEEKIKDDKIIYDNEIEYVNNEIEFVQVPFSHPLYIMFSSGTTGKPKSMVQSVGGVLINHLKELIIHSDLKRNDAITYITSPSWMMWNWLVSSLAVGPQIILYDGNPNHPDWKRMWEIIENDKITVFGCSASYINYLRGVNAKPGEIFDLSSLKEISQTGSPLSPEGFKWIYENVKKDLHFNSISGGTDINGCFAIGSPILPVYPGELQSPGLGMKIKAYDENGNEIYDSVGELVCEFPTPSMPIYFWNDENYERYISSYFSYYREKGKNVWRHGDFVIFHSDTGGITILGRSDTTLKPSGVRIGTGEIYSVIESIPEIEDSVVVGQNYKGDQRIILFVKLKDNIILNKDLEERIKRELRTKASPRHVPDLIFQVPDIPYTFNAKKVEIAVWNIVNGKNVTNRETIINPESLKYFEEIAKKLNSP